jgi:hypothetical protein
MQGRNDEAQKVLQPVIAWYRQEQQAGATGTSFRYDYAYALYVDSLIAPAGAAGSKQRETDLDQAARLLAGASPEAQRLESMRRVSGLVAKPRTATHA